jgi:hypothetical protein
LAIFMVTLLQLWAPNMGDPLWRVCEVIPRRTCFRGGQAQQSAGNATGAV